MDTTTIEDLLKKYEAAETEKLSIRASHEGIFCKLDELNEQQEELKTSLKKLLYTSSGPPKEVPVGKKSHTWARGEMFQVTVTYKAKADYYDPAKLPKEAFEVAGLVTDVNTELCDTLARRDARVKKAKITGEWMTPSMSVKRIERDAPPEEA